MVKIICLAWLIGCANASEPKPEPEKGACTYSYYSSGWISYCYGETTKATCDAMDPAGTPYTVWQSGTCPGAGYSVKCKLYYKSSTCQSWE